MQTALDGVLRNFPIRPAAWLLRALVFPIGRLEAAPGDRLGRRVATLLMYPNEARDRLGEFASRRDQHVLARRPDRFSVERDRETIRRVGNARAGVETLAQRRA